METIVDLTTHGLDVCTVGDTICDVLLGLPTQDRDYVVVGVTPEAMEVRGSYAVGKDFPVFLHPVTHVEYALVHTKHKTVIGYKSFSVYYAPDATLENDLIHHNPTISVMAQRVAEDDVPVGSVIDPHGEQADLASRTSRHVSDVFMEDPVRILRLARFTAHFAGSHVASEANVLVQHMVQVGEVDALMPKRVRQEIARGLAEAYPQCMFTVLRDCGALARLLLELDRLWGVPQHVDYHPKVDIGVYTTMMTETAATMAASLPIRFAALVHDLSKGITPDDILPRHIGHEGRSAPLIEAVCQRLRVPTGCCELALVVAHEYGNIHHCDGFDAAVLIRLLERCDALHKPDRSHQALQVYEADAHGCLGSEDRSYPQTARLLRALEATSSIDADAAVKHHTGSPAHVKQAAHQARIEAVTQTGV